MSTDSPKASASLNKNSASLNGNLGPTGFDTAPTDEDSPDLRERARDVQERIEEGFHEMEARYDDAREQLRTFNDEAVEFIRENPALSVATAVGVGYLVGKLARRRWLA